MPILGVGSILGDEDCDCDFLCFLDESLCEMVGIGKAEEKSMA